MKPKKLLKKLIDTVLKPFGLEIHHLKYSPRNLLRGALEHIRELGFSPNTVIDVGVAIGTHDLYDTFPSSRHILIEPLEEFRPYLERVVKNYPKAEYIIAAATKKPGEVTINVHSDLDCSSLYLENEDSNVNGEPRIVRAVTLDEVCKERELDGTYNFRRRSKTLPPNGSKRGHVSRLTVFIGLLRGLPFMVFG